MPAMIVKGIKPYYQDESVTLYHGDFRDILPKLRGVQLIATSPPYNVGMVYDGYVDLIPWPEWYAMIETLLSMSLKALRPGGILALNLPFVSNQGQLVKRSRRERKITSRGEPIFAWAILKVREVGFLLREPLIWVKSDTEGKAFAIGTGIGSDNNPYLRMAAEGFILASKEHYHMLGGTGKRGANHSRPLDWCKNVWHIRAGWWEGSPVGRQRHPTMWPIPLCDRLILMFSNPGDLVCDPFMGSGRFLMQAKVHNRLAAGIDTSEKYCDIAANRCRQMVMDLRDAT